MGCQSSKPATVRHRDEITTFAEAAADAIDAPPSISSETKDASRRNSGDAAANTSELQTAFAFLGKPSLTVQPKAISFSEPMDVEQTEHFDIKNSDTDPVFFKVKVTHPRHLFFTPKKGRIPSGEAVSIQVTYKPNTDLALKKVKVMVQMAKLEVPMDIQELPPEAWRAALPNHASKDVMTVDFPEAEEETDLQKFMSVQLPMRDDEKAWWE